MKTKLKKIVGSILLMALFLGLIPGKVLAEAAVQLQALFVDQQYSYVDLYKLSSDGLIAVGKDDKFGYIDKSGQVVIPLEYDGAMEFSNGLAAVKKDGKYGYINTKGDLVVPYQYSKADSFRNGYAKVLKGENGSGLYGYINTKGEEVIQPVYTSVSPITDGYAIASITDSTKKNSWYIVGTSGYTKLLDADSIYYNNNYLRIYKGNSYSITDLKGNPVDFNDNTLRLTKVDNKYGYIDMNGNIVLPCEFIYAEQFDVNGLAIVAKEKDNLYAIDKTGNVVIKPDKYYSITRLSTYSSEENKIYYKVSKQDTNNSKVYNGGVVDYTGKVIIPAIYDAINTTNGFTNGLIAVMKNRKFGFVDTKGTTVIPAIYDSANAYFNGLAAVRKDGKWGFIDTQGNTAIPFEYNDIQSGGFKGSLAVVEKDGKAGAIDTAGNTVISFEYNNVRDIYIMPEGLVWTAKYDAASVKTTRIRNYSLFEIKETAEPTQSAVLVDGKRVPFEAFTIDGSNYFKLRDIAKVLHGSGKQVEIGWDDAANSITITTGKGYTAVGGELSVSGNTENKAASITNSKILLNGKEIKLTAYQINGSNYFKLRDLAAYIDFGITWDEGTSTIGIDTSSGYKK